MTDGMEQLRRKVASLMKESEEIQSYKKDIDWLRTLRTKVARSKFD